jgi:hypothetical protein
MRKERYEEKKKLGICVACNEPAQPDKVKCKNHYDRDIKRTKEFFSSELGKDYRKKYAYTTKRRFWASSHEAKRRNKEWKLTFEQFEQFSKQPCCYCEYPTLSQGGSLDRIDNNRGYTIDNVVSACRTCNLVRNNLFTHEEMKVIGKTIKAIRDARKPEGFDDTKENSQLSI